MNLSSKIQFYIIVAILVILLIGLSFSIHLLFGMIVEEGNKIIEIQSESLSLSKQRDQINETSKEYDDIKDIVARLDERLMSADDKLDFIILIENLARDAGVEHLLDISGAQDAISANINVSGAFSGVLKFIYYLENSSYYISVEKVQLSGDKNKDSVKAQISIRVYVK